MPVELYYWQHRPAVINLPILDRIRRKAIPNFGDEIGPIIVRALLRNRNLPAAEDVPYEGRLVSVGSVFHKVESGDYVWGTGINAKLDKEFVAPGEVTITAVRGPRTRDRLIGLGYTVPEVYGDPALLLREVPEYARIDTRSKRRTVAVIPNFNEIDTYRGHPGFVSPLQPPLAVASEIAASEMVVGSSLHAMVFADALGVPSRLIASASEHPFKYEDYYQGSGREVPLAASTVDEAVRLGPVEENNFNSQPLLDAFPAELFRT